MIENIVTVLNIPFMKTAIISFLGGVIAALTKGVRGVPQIAAVIVVALVAGVWLSPLAVLFLEQLSETPLEGPVEDSITAVVAISSWGLVSNIEKGKFPGRLGAWINSK